MSHPNQKILEKMYEQFTSGDTTSFLHACSDNITFQIAGKNGGKFTKANFASDFLAKLFSKGFSRLEIHEVLASDRHGVVLASDFFKQGEKEIQVRTVHVWRFENGSPVAWYEYPRDLYQLDALLG